MTKQKCGYVAIIGAPNAGKSTLINALVGEKISIVTPKVQTTRHRIRGICMQEDAQIIFIDTPGVFDAKEKFEKAMVNAAWSSLDEADAVLWIVDASSRDPVAKTADISERMKQLKKTVFIALNKIDLIPKERLMELAQAFHSATHFETFMISALKEDGTQDILKRLGELMPESPWLYPPDELSDSTERMLAAEITREQCFMQLGQELPYSLAVDTEAWEEKSDGSVKISQIIYVLREAHKKMVIGAGGAKLKLIGEKARKQITHALGRKAHLFLHVKVREDWKNQREFYTGIGLEYK